MHEYSLVSAMLDRVRAEARARSAVAVHKLGVRIGAVSGVEPELFASAFTLCREGLLAQAELDLRRAEAVWDCPQCGRPLGGEKGLRCVGCGVPARLVSGDEIVLEQIEMEVP